MNRRDDFVRPILERWEVPTTAAKRSKAGNKIRRDILLAEKWMQAGYYDEALICLDAIAGRVKAMRESAAANAMRMEETAS